MWYNLAKTSQTRFNYMDIGHDGYETGEYGCAYLYIYTKNEGFQSIQESEKNKAHYQVARNHPEMKDFSETSENNLFRGRIDICKKQASIVGCEECSGFSLRGNPGINIKICARYKKDLLDSIFSEFGSLKIFDMEEDAYRWTGPMA